MLPYEEISQDTKRYMIFCNRILGFVWFKVTELGVSEIFALLGCCVLYIGGLLPTFRNEVSVPSSRVKTRPIGYPETSVRSHQSTLRKIPEQRAFQCRACWLVKCREGLVVPHRVLWWWTALAASRKVLPHYYYYLLLYWGADKSLARPNSQCILFDGEKISFDASLVLYIYIVLIFLQLWL